MKRIFTFVALMATVHMAALAGGVVYAWSQDWLTRDRILRAYAVLRGEEEAPPAASGQQDAADELPKSASAQIERNVALDARERIELDRREQEIRHSFGLLETEQLALIREKEALLADKQRFAAERDAQARQAGDTGIQRELEILSGIKPKAAKELLKLKTDADVVRIFMSMKIRQARKIVAACKTSEERSWIERVLGTLHEQDATQAEALAASS